MEKVTNNPCSKKSDLSAPSNWRPINVLGVVSKVLERHIRGLLEQYILPKLSKNQFGFIRGRSTEDALMYADHALRLQMSTATGRKGSVSAVSFDVKKAFDSVPFQKLIDCLRHEYKVPECLLSWLSSYFQDRKQAVKVNKSMSTWRQVKAGVVQGSVIGPILFIAYFDKVVLDNSGRGLSIKYADDLILVHPNNNAEDEKALQQTIDDMANALSAKSLSLNASKCQFTTVSESTIPYIPRSPPRVNGIALEYTSELDYLGVALDTKLTWHTNTMRKIAKAKQALGSIRRLVKNKLPLTFLRNLLLVKILPVFLYSITVTYPRLKTDRVSLEGLNKFVARLVTNDYITPYHRLLPRADILPIFKAVLYRRIQLAQRYSRGQRYLPQGSIRTRFRTRTHNFGLLTEERTGMRYRDSALETLVQTWSRLPAALVNGNSPNISERLIKANYEDNQWIVCADMSASILMI